MKVDIYHTYSVTEINEGIELPDNLQKIDRIYIDGMNMIVEGLDVNSEKFKVSARFSADNKPDYSRPDTIKVIRFENEGVTDYEVLHDWSCV